MSILRADSIRDRAGTGAADFPNGLTGNVTGTATTATALSGTPKITVGTVTGTDATFSGNLTLNVTTTTIDTAVTAVDSLSVDGNVTALGTLGIGTVTPGRHLTVSGGASEGAIQITNNTSGHTAANGFELIHFTSGETQFLNRENGAMRFDTNGLERLRIDSSGLLGVGGNGTGSGLGVYLQRSSPATTHFYEASDGTKKMIAGVDSGNDYVKIGSLSNHPVGLVANNTERLRITSGGTAIFKAGLAEKYNDVGGTLGSNTNNSMNNGNVIQFDGNESGNLTINFTDVHATLSQGENCSFTVLIRPNGSGVINAVQIDSQSPAGGLRWSGGSVPSAGAASSYDIYTFTIFKYGTANTNYRVFGAATNYA